MGDEFYVGYMPNAPVVLSRRLRVIIALLGAAGLAIAVALVLGQSPFASSKFEWGIYREYTGTIDDLPYPTLATSAGRYLLVAEGKHGLRGYPSGRVTLMGSLIARGDDRMLEVRSGTIHSISGTQVVSSPANLGQVRLRGEIVDSKCYLGVMNPGNGKVHRDCAARCISGGLPAAFVVRDTGQVILLSGLPAKEVLPFVAEPVVVAGELVRQDSVFVLKVSSLRRE